MNKKYGTNYETEIMLFYVCPDTNIQTYNSAIIEIINDTINSHKDENNLISVTSTHYLTFSLKFYSGNCTKALETSSPNLIIS